MSADDERLDAIAKRKGLRLEQVTVESDESDLTATAGAPG